MPITFPNNYILSGFEDLTRVNVLRCEQVFHPIDEWTETDWACAMAGEAGEACNAIKKRRRGDGVGPSVDETLSEIADTVIYACLLAYRVSNHDPRALGNAIVQKFNAVSDKRSSDVRIA